jgi:GDP-4-dehydro-6-deoxy-D-mannose reductase
VYAQTKLAAEQELWELTSSRGVPMVVARVFGLLAPNQAPNYLLPALIQRAKTGQLAGIPGLDFVRDYLDARDVCENLLLIASTPWPETSPTINVCSGVGVTIRTLLRAVLEEVDPKGADRAARRATAAQGRPDDIRWLVGDPGRFERLTGSVPRRIPLARTVADAVSGVG